MKDKEELAAEARTEGKGIFNVHDLCVAGILVGIGLIGFLFGILAVIG